MNTRNLAPIVLSFAFSIGAWLIFAEFVTASESTIALYVFISCILVTLSSLFPKTGSASISPADGETTTLYVGNLPYRANEDAVKRFIGEHVPVQSVRLMKDKRTGKRKGYGFIEIVTNDVNDAIEKLNDIVFQERTLKVRPAKEKVEG